jgi:MFS family permease
MNPSSRVAPARPPRLATVLYLYLFLDDLRPLYPVYPLLFADAGLSVAQTSSLFVVWSVTGLLLEVPSGAFADVVSRRAPLFLGPLLTAAGFTLWVAVPSYWAFALGFVLWGAQGAMTSGALEALVHDGLDRCGAADRYATVMGRGRAAGLVAVMVATAAAGPLLAVGGNRAVGLVSVLTCLLTAAVALAFPAGHTPATDDGDPGYAATLRAGLAEVRRHRPVRVVLLLLAPVTAIWGGLEEYVPLLARDTGVTSHQVPPLMLVVGVAVAAGGLLATLGGRWGRRPSGAVLCGAALALASGSLTGSPWGILAVAAAFCVLQAATVVLDARLQDAITGPGRATVTSLASLGTEVVTLAVYGGYALASTVAGNGLVFALFAVPYLLIGSVLVTGSRRGGTVPR